MDNKRNIIMAVLLTGIILFGWPMLMEQFFPDMANKNEVVEQNNAPANDQASGNTASPAIVPATTTHITAEVSETGDSRTATGCSAGQITAKARVIRDPRTQSLTPGDILVARHTDPGWIAVFSNASAIVVERGSLLSHSAIVARELGIPCVVGLKGATQWVKDGDVLQVDGATGLVSKHGAKL